MDFSTEFFWNSLWAAAFAFFFFSLPGLCSALLLGFRANLSVLFIAPALGLSIFGPFSLFFTWIIGYSEITVAAVWVFFQCIALFIYFKYICRPTFGSVSAFVPNDMLNTSRVGWLLSLSALWALIPVFNIYPLLFKEGLYVNIHIFDHMKIAIIDGIAREGLPPLNPFYAPNGERVPLIYYYAWHFFGAQVKTISGVSGWQAEVAMSWFTSFATIAFISSLAVRLSGRLWAGFAVLLLGLAGPPAEILSPVMGARWEGLVGYPPIHPLEPLWIQLSWAPQHVFASLCTVLLLFLMCRDLLSTHLRWYYSVAIGLIAAAGFGASIWVGGVALTLFLPVLLIVMLLVLWRIHIDFTNRMMPLLFALGVCAIFALPVLSAVTSGPATAKDFPLALKLYYATGLFQPDSSLHVIGHIILYWLQFLPLCLGIVYLIGLLAIPIYKIRNLETRLLKYLSLAVIFAYLLMVQWVQSIIVNNDFGWRTVNVPFMLLLIWAAVFLADLPHDLPNWHYKEMLRRARLLVFPLIGVGITVGLLASFRSWHLPQANQRQRPLSKEKQALHKDFFFQREAWDALRRYTDSGDLVQNNPSIFAKVVTPWSAPASVALFGDRPVAFSEPESVNVFAHPYDKKQKVKQYKAIQALFEVLPTPNELKYARDTLNIKALLVVPRDPVWHSRAIENSGIYRLAESTDNYKIYLAVTVGDKK